MSSPWTDLLFLHGHIHDPALARRLAMSRDTAKPTLRPGKRVTARPALATPRRSRLAGVWQFFTLRPQLR